MCPGEDWGGGRPRAASKTGGRSGRKFSLKKYVGTLSAIRQDRGRVVHGHDVFSRERPGGSRTQEELQPVLLQKKVSEKKY